MKQATAWIIGMLALAVSCRREATQEKGEAPPAVASAVAGLCGNGGAKVSDPSAAKLLPSNVAGYCLDPNNEIRTYGKDGKGTIEQVCTELFDGECEVYRSYGLERVVAARYADGSGTPGTVSVNLSRFESVQGALGFFTKRVIGDADPATLTTSELQAGALAVQGSGTAYIWRGAYVVELAYANDNESPDAIRTSGQKILTPLAQAMGELLPGDKELPQAARLLPKQDRLPLGLSFDVKDALGIEGVGPAAVGYYRSAGKRYRVLALQRANDQAAQDIMKTLKRSAGATEVKTPQPSIRLQVPSLEGTTKLEWVFGRGGAAVIGIGDEEHARGADGSAPVSLSSVEKQAMLAGILQHLQANPGK
jgi:hypothetical protein